MFYFTDGLGALPGVMHAFGDVSNSGKPTNLFYCAQKHGAQVVEVGDKEAPGIIAADAVFTRTTRPIGVVTADCLPILIGSEKDQFVAAIHGGWQGLAAGVIENSLLAFHRAGVCLDHLRVAIGPSIQPCCYEVAKPLVDQIERTHGHLWRGRQAPWSTLRRPPERDVGFSRAPASHNQAWFDLALYCHYLLEAAGLNCEQIQAADICTYCASHHWGSYRRRTHQVEEKTFQYSWIYLQEF